MRRIFLIALLALVGPVAAQTPPALVQEAVIPLPATRGRIDHLTVDLKRGRLFVAELGNNTVDVVDIAARRVIHRIAGLDEPQGLAYDPKSDLLAVASGGDGTLKLFSARDYRLRATVRLGDDPDNVRLDPRNNLLVVGYGSGNRGALAVVDPARAVKLRELPLPGHPESFRLSGARAFVNLPDARKIIVGDIDSGKITAEWAMARGGNFPMILDDAGRVAVVFRNSSSLVLFDARNGRQVAEATTCFDSDDVFHDSRRKLFYVSCGSGHVDVFGTAEGGPRQRGRIATALGARTSYFVPELDRLFVAERATILAGNAALAVLKPTD